MTPLHSPKLIQESELEATLTRWREAGCKIVFTNGCFDVFHAGHAYVLNSAKSFGDRLIVGLNSDESVRKLKGITRPLNKENHRAYVLAAMTAVDAVVVFEDETPLKLIQKILPDVLVKGGDYSHAHIAGADFVTANGGRVEIVPLLDNLSSSGIINAK